MTTPIHTTIAPPAAPQTMPQDITPAAESLPAIIHNPEIDTSPAQWQAPLDLTPAE